MYSINDCVLIKKVREFPEHGILKTPVHNHDYTYSSSLILGSVINKKLSYLFDDIDKFSIASKRFRIYNDIPDRTTHFTINGIGEEDNFKYAIIEPLKYHINDSSLESLRVEDTYFSDNMELSNESIILVPEGDNNIKASNICAYTGSLDEAIKNKMIEKNYPIFTITHHGYLYGNGENTNDNEMLNLINNLAKEKDISQERYYLSEYYYDDLGKRNESDNKIDKLYLKYILSNCNITNSYYNKILNLVDLVEKDEDYDSRDLLDEELTKLIDHIGLTKLDTLTIKFNKEMLTRRNSEKANTKGKAK